MNTIAAPVVSLVRKFPAPRPPNIVAPPPPPNTAPTCAPLPRCNSTTAIRKMHTRTWRAVTTMLMRFLFLLEMDDPGECRGVEARAAHECAVDVGLRHQVVDVLGLDRAAVLDPDRVAGGAEPRTEPLAHEPVHLLRGLGRGGAAGADRPNRLVGDHQLGGARIGYERQAAGDLAG